MMGCAQIKAARLLQIADLGGGIQRRESVDNEITVGDKVRTGVYVLGEFVSIYLGIVTDVSADKSTALVDVMSLHGGAPWIRREQTSHLRKVMHGASESGDSDGRG